MTETRSFHALISTHKVNDHGYVNYLTTSFLNDRLNLKLNTDEITKKYVLNLEKLKEFLMGFQNATHLKYDDSHYVISEDYFISIYPGSDNIDMTILGDSNVIQEIVKKSYEYLDDVKNLPNLIWYYIHNGSTTCETLPLSPNPQPAQEMYPFLNEPLNDYYRRYYESASNVLILQGPPGTGKTTFLRGLLTNLNKSAIITYDEHIIRNDEIFMNFITGDDDFIVFEDADAFLSNRTDGNPAMHRFLNIGDGLVSRQNKKIIFTTNLPSVQDIDPALTREGRCFDILQFRNLTANEVQNLMKSQNLNLETSNQSLSLAQVFNSPKQSSSNKKKVGFI